MRIQPLALTLVLLGLSYAATAEQTTADPLQKAIESLSLDNDRQAQLKTLIEENKTVRAAHFKKMQALRAEGRDQQDNFRQQIDDLLTDEEEMRFYQLMHTAKSKGMKGKPGGMMHSDSSHSRHEGCDAQR